MFSEKIMSLSARKIVENLRIKKNEIVLIISDDQNERIAKDIRVEAKRKGAIVSIALIEKGYSNEPPKPIANAMKKADVVICPLKWSLTHTRATQQACKAGARVATLPDINEKIYKSKVFLSDPKDYRRLTKKLAKILNKGNKVEITNIKGTDISFSIKNRKAKEDLGIIRKGNCGNLPGGEVFIAPIENSANGIMVDWEGKIIEVKDGKIIAIKGKYAKKLYRWIEKHKNANIIAEFGIGTNPKAKFKGTVLIDEKVLGTCHIAFGNNINFGGINKSTTHYDRIIERPTIKIDGKLIMKNGRLFV